MKRQVLKQQDELAELYSEVIRDFKEYFKNKKKELEAENQVKRESAKSEGTKKSQPGE